MRKQQQYQNIIVDACMHLGDLIHASTVIPLLRELYPDVKVTFLVSAGLEELLYNVGRVNAVIPYKYKSGGSYLGVFEMAQNLRKYNFDLSISLDPRTRLSAMMWLAGIPTRVGSPSVFGWKPGIEKFFFNEYIDFTGYDVRKNSAAMNFQELIKRFAGNNKVTTFYIPKFILPSSVTEEYIKSKMAQIPKKALKVAICVKTVEPARNWQPAKFNAVIKHLIKKYNAYIIGVGVNGDEETFQNSIREIDSARIVNFIGKTNLMQLNALFRECDFAINPDNGMGHFAAAAGCPTITLVPNVDPEKYKPLHPLTQVVASGCECIDNCNNILRKNCGFKCLDMITVDMVLNAVHTLIGNLESNNQ